MDFLFGLILQFVGELLIQVVVEVLFEMGVRGALGALRTQKAFHPGLAALLYAGLGVLAGWISLCVFPTLFIASPALRIANLVVTPIAAGAAMAALGAWRRRRDQELLRIDRFSYGFLFALATCLVRLAFGR